jgi:tetratricopeptide (TPR) repeat protein
MRRFLLLTTSLACLSGCTCGKSPPSPSAVDAGVALSPPPALPPNVKPPPAPPPVPERAMQLHMQGREHGEVGAFAQALQALQQAREAAPQWPLPLYDVGLTYLYMKEDAKALEAYEQLDTLAPQGISDSKRMLDSLRREKDGRVPQGTLREFLELMRLKDLDEIHRRLEALTKRAPAFVPAWQELARLSSEKPEEAQRLVAKALALEPDTSTRAELLTYQAVLLRRQGQSEAARKQLEALRDDPRTPPSVAAEVRELLSIPDNVTP